MEKTCKLTRLPGHLRLHKYTARKEKGHRSNGEGGFIRQSRTLDFGVISTTLCSGMIRKPTELHRLLLCCRILFML